ncbi:MAG: hypothetical protein B6D61_07780 [Bacteroidetes bacterium 4484_249]|nr:MAG: hypothetical protein B6D61_07780 [Bacteroidetes bacterium 4484_249]
MKQSKSVPNKQGAPRPAAAGGFRLTAFPKEFERNILEGFDRRYYLILLISFFIVYGMVIIFANKEYSSEAINNAVKKNYLKKFYNTEFVVEQPQQQEDTNAMTGGEEAAPEEKVDQRAKKNEGKRAEASGTSAADRRAARRAAAAKRSSQRSAMEQSVAGTGILAELSAGGGGGSGAAVYDVLGDQGAGGVGNLDQVLGGVSGLQSASSGSRRSVLGARSTGGGAGAAGIDDLIEGGVGQSGSVSIKRRGKFSIKIDKGTVSGKGSKSANRSADAIGRVVNKHADAIENCYKKETRINPNLKGSLSVQFTIMPNGKVSNVRVVNSTLRNKKVESCVTRRIRSWRFSKINKKEGNVTFRQKYIFGS